MKKLWVVLAIMSMGMQSQAAEKALFAGGCFWCMEAPFEKVDGVTEVRSGYAGGSTKKPTYKNYGQNGHVEVVQVIFDPEKVSYADLLHVFWRQIDPTDAGGQFVDRGAEYRAEIFTYNEEQKALAEQSKQDLAETGPFKKRLVTQIVPAPEFYPAEDYHQNYYKRNKIRYKYYRGRSGRDKFLDSMWGKDRKEHVSKAAPQKYRRPDEDVLRAQLSPLQYQVTQKEGTEPPFQNDYWANKREGIYVDRVSGEPLFSSRDKFKSGTGWPSFTKPLDAENVMTRNDRKLFTVRTEVRSKHGDSHLGHVFEDGPQPTGLRYCINSAALRFVPKEGMEEEGYGEYTNEF